MHFSVPKTQIEAIELSANFLKDEKKATEIYANAMIKVSGLVKEVSFLNNTKTLILYGENDQTSIICEMNLNFNLTDLPKENDSIVLKGICKGFLKDVILLNCQLIKK